MSVGLFQCLADVHFPSQPQAPQARAAFSTQVLFRSTSPSAAEVHRGCGLAQCAMAVGYRTGMLLLGSRARCAVGCACPAETNADRREIE